jgi:capsular polysaccharide biosynthesis protein
MDFVPDLQSISDIVECPQFNPSRLTRLVVAGAAPFPAALPLLCAAPEFVDDWLVKWHLKPGLPLPVQINCYFASNAVISGRGHVFLDGCLVLSPEFIPAYWNALIVEAGQGIDIEWERQLPTKTVEEPCVVFTGHGIDVYGHLLIEMLPKLHMVKKVIGGLLPRHKILMDRNAPQWFVNIVSGYYEIHDEDFVYFDSRREKVLLAQAILPALCCRDGHFHIFNNTVFDDIVADCGGGLDIPRIFVTRALFRSPSSAQRRCINEFEVAEVAVREFNFTPIAPETMPWREQIKLFASARVIFGEFGSGMHNTLFSAPGARVAVLDFNNLTQSGISALRSQQIGYLKVPHEADGHDFRVDLNLLRRFLDGILNAPPLSR